jgi:hypothetical protein
LTAYSDHSPIEFTVRCNSTLNRSRLQYTSTNCKWNSDFEKEFCEKLAESKGAFDECISAIDADVVNTIDVAVDEFTELLTSIGKPLFEKTFRETNSVYFSDINRKKSQKWFNKECIDTRKEYTSALHTYHNTLREVDMHVMFEKKRLYRRCVRKSRLSYKQRLSREMSEMKCKNPREFWKFFKRKKGRDASSSINHDVFENHFRELHSVEDEFGDINVESFIDELNENNEASNDAVFPELDDEISLEEVLRSIAHLKCEKQHGIDNIINEYMIKGSDTIAPILCTLFNVILTTGHFPVKWGEGVIVPIHKQGDVMDVNNYRGITMMSCVSKLFTRILNVRLTNWSRQNDRLSDAQFGFKEGVGTVDAIYVLHSIISKYMSNGKRLYCAFVDFKKAFDSVYRNGVWFKIFKQGVTGKMFSVLRSMYSVVKSCVLHLGVHTDFFKFNVGLRQGEILSPMLFSLFLEDLETHLQDSGELGIELEQLTLFLILFADDLVLMSETAEGLQNMLNALHGYCVKWNLVVNVAKTKLMVFRRGGVLKANEVWRYNNEHIDVVDVFVYLGLLFASNGKFLKTTQLLAEKGLKAGNMLMSQVRELNMKPSVIMNLFDTCVAPVVSYAAEVWGFHKAEAAERVHRKFCKQLLKVKQSTCNSAVYGELGRMPLICTRMLKIVKYWFKVRSSKNIILQTTYMEMLNNYGYQ